MPIKNLKANAALTTPLRTDVRDLMGEKKGGKKKIVVAYGIRTPNRQKHKPDAGC